MLMNRLKIHCSIGLKPTSASQAACRHAQDTNYAKKDVAIKFIHAWPPTSCLELEAIFPKRAGFSSFSFVYCPCTSKSARKYDQACAQVYPQIGLESGQVSFASILEFALC